ncbi:MAG: GIY-YIG nuclease family protein [Candidatus Marinimicrobia bacterium]|nr:GIY-YIG nuclease family protein [Candidatus Neomarinimicrobiota bacterium]
MPQKITVYILSSKVNAVRYIGITNNISRRLKEHRSTGSTVERLLGTFDLIYKEEYFDYKSARKREKFLKSGKGREWMNEHFKDGTRPT